MCARFPRPVNAVALAADDGAGAEALAAVLSDGSVAFARALEADDWEAALEEQSVWVGQRARIFGRDPSATAAAAAGAPLSAAPRARPQPTPSGQHQALRTRVAAAWDEQRVLLPLGAFAPTGPAVGGAGSASGGGGGIPLAEGRRAKAAAWLAPGRLLLVCAPHPEAGLEAGAGDVLAEAAVELPEPLLSAAEGEEASVAGDGAEAPRVEELGCGYAGGAVIAAAPLAGGGGANGGGGGALLQLASGALLRCVPGAGGACEPLGPSASFAEPCPTMVPLPPGSGAAAAAGLSAGGTLYVGARALVRGATSLAVREGGAGGPALLYTTRSSLLYTVMLRRLGAYQHKEPDVAALPPRHAADRGADALRAAMCAAMRPPDAVVAARGVHVRAVEDGARLVAAPAGGHVALLQMPRGNLEAVCPRLLTLTATVGALRAGDYAAAWRLAARQRLDLNLLVDDAWPRFLDAAPAFVAAVAEPARLCDLLFALKPGSTLAPGGAYEGLEAAAGLAPAPRASPEAEAAAEREGKVAAVCRTVREAVVAACGGGDGSGSGSGEGASGSGSSALFTRARMLKVVVTSFARGDPPDLESALLAIRDAKEAALAAGDAPAVSAAPAAVGDGGSSSEGDDDGGGDLNGDATPAAAAANGAAVATNGACPAGPGLGAAADGALRHLLLHADADRLYQCALGLYDLALAFLVVSHAQKDPGEYLDELARFGAVPDERLRRHAIDVHLRRWPRALENLAEAGPAHFEAALRLARERGLVRQLIAVVQRQADEAAAAATAAATAGGTDSAAAVAAAEAAAAANARLAAALRAHAEALAAARRHEDAAVALLAAGDADAALAAYSDGGHWRMALALAGRLGWPQERVQSLAADLAASLQSSGQGADAARVLLDYLGDADGAVAALAGAKEWREALRVAHARGRCVCAEGGRECCLLGGDGLC